MDGDQATTIYVEVVLLIVTLFLLWGAGSIISYLRQPFCFYCDQEGYQTRTKYADDEGRPECVDHYWEHRMAAEHIIECPIHHLKMEKYRVEGSIIVDVCPHNGCAFLNPGELDKIREIDQSRASSTNSAIMAGIIASSAMTASINASC